MDAAQLLKIMPQARSRIAAFADPLLAAMTEFDIVGPARQASFLSQIGHESGQLAHVVENLNYSAAGLLTTFPKYFTKSSAAAYARKPQRIASLVYANRMGNGDEASCDGWAYRGRGLIQVTGRTNYTACMMGLDIDCVEHPELLELPVNACRSAAWWWKSHGCNELADNGDQTAVTRRVNGGTNGLADRLALFAVAQEVLK